MAHIRAQSALPASIPEALATGRHHSDSRSLHGIDHALLALAQLPSSQAHRWPLCCWPWRCARSPSIYVAAQGSCRRSSLPLALPTPPTRRAATRAPFTATPRVDDRRRWPASCCAQPALQLWHLRAARCCSGRPCMGNSCQTMYRWACPHPPRVIHALVASSGLARWLLRLAPPCCLPACLPAPASLSCMICTAEVANEGQRGRRRGCLHAAEHGALCCAGHLHERGSFYFSFFPAPAALQCVWRSPSMIPAMLCASHPPLLG